MKELNSYVSFLKSNYPDVDILNKHWYDMYGLGFWKILDIQWNGFLLMNYLYLLQFYI